MLQEHSSPKAGLLPAPRSIDETVQLFGIESALEKSLSALKGKPAGVRKTKPTGIRRQRQPQSSRNIILDGHLELIK